MRTLARRYTLQTMNTFRLGRVACFEASKELLSIELRQSIHISCRVILSVICRKLSLHSENGVLVADAGPIYQRVRLSSVRLAQVLRLPLQRLYSQDGFGAFQRYGIHKSKSFTDLVIQSVSWFWTLLTRLVTCLGQANPLAAGLPGSSISRRS